ncbi:MAG: response regulator [Terracidiphilus sp.]
MHGFTEQIIKALMESAVTPTIPGSGKVLVVDDEPSVAQTLEMILLQRGYDVRAVLSAEAAIELIAAWAPDVAIVDVMLPRMNGIELGSVLQDNYPNCRLLLVSGYPGSADLLEEAQRRGCTFEILPKPLHPSSILEIVSGMLPRGRDEAQA